MLTTRIGHVSGISSNKFISSVLVTQSVTQDESGLRGLWRSVSIEHDLGEGGRDICIRTCRRNIARGDAWYMEMIPRKYAHRSYNQHRNGTHEATTDDELP